MSDKQSRQAKKTPKPAAKKAAVPKVRPNRKKADQSQLSEEEAALAAEQKPLTQAEELFCQAYFAKGLNATQAYLSLHPNVKNGTARTEGCKTLAKPHIARRVSDIAAERAKEFEVEGNELLRHAHAVATADHRHLTQYVYRCCRYCYGLNHQFQRTRNEMDRDRAEHQKAELKREANAIIKNKVFVPTEFDEKGGDGFNEWLDPAEDCPVCFGKGKGRMEIADTRYLPPDAAVLFAGVEETRTA
jgi:phage terminase small subunit